MSMKQVVWRGAGCGVLVLAVALGTPGCEKAEGMDGLSVNPDAVTMGPGDRSVAITVSGGITNTPLALPLEWHVSNRALGTIEITGPTSATYRRTGQVGINTVTVRDQFKNEGFCVVEQVDAMTHLLDQEGSVYVLALTASPESPISMGSATTISITATEGMTPPYSWRKVSGPGSLSAGSGSTSAVYSSSTPGVGVIRVTDGNGVQGVLSIVVEDPGAADPDDPDDGNGDTGIDPFG